jgi:hypothetical protein
MEARPDPATLTRAVKATVRRPRRRVILAAAALGVGALALFVPRCGSPSEQICAPYCGQPVSGGSW